MNATETNPLLDPFTYHANKSLEMTLFELENAGGTLSRVRLFTERRGRTAYTEVSYIDGTLPTGETVEITDIPFHGPRANIMQDFRQWAVDECVDGETLRLYDPSIWSTLS